MALAPVAQILFASMLALLCIASVSERARARSPEDKIGATASVAVHATAVSSASVGSIWSTRAPIATARQELAVAELDGKIYVIGGIGAGPSLLSSVEVYDPSFDSWSPGPALPVALHHTTATAAFGKLYVIGGWSDFFATPLAVVYELDPMIGSWLTREPMPTPRGSPAAAALDGLIYVAGGLRGGASVSDFAVYDPISDDWQTLAPLPSARNHLALATAAGLIFVIGGRARLGAGLGNVSDVDAYDPTRGTWSSASPLARARSGLAGVGIGRFVFAFGGEGNSENPNGVFADAEVYDTATGVWTALDPMPTPRHGIGAAALDLSIYIPGGGSVQGFGVDDAHEVIDVTSLLSPSVPGFSVPGVLLLSLALASAYYSRPSSGSPLPK